MNPRFDIPVIANVSFECCIYRRNILAVLLVGADIAVEQLNVEVSFVPALAIVGSKTNAAILIFVADDPHVTCVIDDFEIGNGRRDPTVGAD